MASVQNRVYPQGEYGEIRTNLLRTNDIIATTISGSKIIDTSTAVASAAYTGSAMSPGETIIYTGAGGGTASLYIKLSSGSIAAIWSAALTYIGGCS